MKISLDIITFSDIKLDEVTNIMTTDNLVRKEVLDVIKRMVKPGMPVTKTVWKAAYYIVRAEAIRDTQAWKKQYITIE